MIISTGMRTDIPAFYSKWFMNRIREGYVCARNPYYPKLVTKYNLNSDYVDCIQFCTKNPYPMLKYLDELKQYNMLWYVTITPYGKDIEPNVWDKNIIIKSFQELAKKLPNSFVGWRYDPIFLNKDFTVERHIKEFENIAKQLKGYTTTCAISFLDLYEKVKRNAPNLIRPCKNDQIKIAQSFSRIGKKYGIEVYACCEASYLKEYGLNCTGCQNSKIIQSAISYKINLPKVKNTRDGCLCFMGNDIGAYDSCGHFCRYCYANTNRSNVINNLKNHFDDSPLLIGRIQDDDIVKESSAKSYRIKSEQISLF